VSEAISTYRWFRSLFFFPPRLPSNSGFVLDKALCVAPVQLDEPLPLEAVDVLVSNT